MTPFGLAGVDQSIPVPGDYEFPRVANIAVYLPTICLFADRPRSAPDVIGPLGSANDGTIPIVGDFNRSTQDEPAIFDPNYALFAHRPRAGADVLSIFGAAGIGGSLPVSAPPAANDGDSASVASVETLSRADPSLPRSPRRRY